MTNDYQAPLGTTPHKNPYRQEYDINYVYTKAANCWYDLWDNLGISLLELEKNKCPLCKYEKTFKVTDLSRGTFFCSQCKITGDGVHLLQHYHKWDKDEAIERIGRSLRIRDKVAYYG